MPSPVPSETHAAEVHATVRELEGGLAQLALSKAVNRIDDWKREIETAERADLQPIADGLGDLHGALVGTSFDALTVGMLLSRLGQQTEDAADSVPPSTPEDDSSDLQASLKRLGSLLRHAGGALSGNATADTRSDR